MSSLSSTRNKFEWNGSLKLKTSWRVLNSKSLYKCWCFRLKPEGRSLLQGTSEIHVTLGRGFTYYNNPQVVPRVSHRAAMAATTIKLLIIHNFKDSRNGVEIDWGQSWIWTANFCQMSNISPWSLLMAQQGQGTCARAWRPEFEPQDSHGKRLSTPWRCALTPACALRRVSDSTK